MWTLILGAILGTLGSIGAAIAVEYLRRLRLFLTIEKPPLDWTAQPNAPAQAVRSLRLVLANKELPRWARWMVRAPALQCRAAISFHHLDGQNVCGRVMSGRWAGSPQPVPLPVVGPGGQQFQLIDYERLTLASRIDVYPGDEEILDVAIRADTDAECYGWNNEAYFSNPKWRNPAWKLSPGRYLVRAEVISSGQKCRGIFRLINDVPRSDFRLEPAGQEDPKFSAD